MGNTTQPSLEKSPTFSFAVSISLRIQLQLNFCNACASDKFSGTIAEVISANRTHTDTGIPHFIYLLPYIPLVTLEIKQKFWIPSINIKITNFLIYVVRDILFFFQQNCSSNLTRFLCSFLVVPLFHGFLNPLLFPWHWEKYN